MPTLNQRRVRHSTLGRLKIWPLIGLLGFSFLAFGVRTVEANWQQPLTQLERNQAEQLVLNGGTTPTLRMVNETGVTSLGVQVLMIERTERKRASNELSQPVQVFTFDHVSHLTEVWLIDTNINAIISTQTINNVHLPLSEDEINYTKQQVLQNPELKIRLQEEIRTYNQNLTNVSIAIDPRVAVWVPQSLEHSLVSGCDKQRCALVSLFDPEGGSYTVEPIFNFGTGQLFLDLVQ